MSFGILRQSALCAGLSHEEVLAVAESAKTVSFKKGEVICREDEPGESMFIVASGRVRITVSRDGTDVRVVDDFGAGHHFGEMAMLGEGKRSATVTAVMDTELLEIGQAAFDKLLVEVSGFAANLSRTLCARLRREISGQKKRSVPKVIGLLNASGRTQQLLNPLILALMTAGESVQVLTDRTQSGPTNDKVPVEYLPARLRGQEKIDAVRDRLAEVVAKRDRVLVDVLAIHAENELLGILSQCEQIWLLAEPEVSRTSVQVVSKLIAAHPELAPHVHVVWILRESKEFPHPEDIGLKIARRDFKVILMPTEGAISDRQQRSLARLVHHLDGRRIGLALGGGGARGLAHLGVLRALERAGIYFDHIAGTSVGALMGLAYCAGWTPDQALIDFKRDLTPGWLFRMMPRGSHWYMLSKFRFGAWDRMLRRYVAAVTLEQLEIPLSTVAVDLITGQQVIRHTGDAIHAVLESINLPVISRPIIRDGMALVDGGILNNLPANVLIDDGADFVVAVDIAAGLKSEFAGNTPTTPVEEMRRPGTLETIMRVNDVQDYQVTATQAHVADHIIGINTSGFAFADFTKAVELAELGEATTEEAIPALKQLLAEYRGR